MVQMFSNYISYGHTKDDPNLLDPTHLKDLLKMEFESFSRDNLSGRLKISTKDLKPMQVTPK